MSQDTYNSLIVNGVDIALGAILLAASTLAPSHLLETQSIGFIQRIYPQYGAKKASVFASTTILDSPLFDSPDERQHGEIDP